MRLGYSLSYIPIQSNLNTLIKSLYTVYIIAPATSWTIVNLAKFIWFRSNLPTAIKGFRSYVELETQLWRGFNSTLTNYIVFWGELKSWVYNFGSGFLHLIWDPNFIPDSSNILWKCLLVHNFYLLTHWDHIQISDARYFSRIMHIWQPLFVDYLAVLWQSYKALLLCDKKNIFPIKRLKPVFE